MENRRRLRLVENATNQSSVELNQGKGTPSGEARDCQTCGQSLGTRSGPLGNWDAFPAGVKFDPSDEELLQHLGAEVGREGAKSHPLINNFISVLSGEDGICQTHPENLPGVKKDGSSKHFFHRPAKAYTTGTRKRRKIHSVNEEPGVETRWHKTGKTRSVCEEGHILGWKKIMVLYRNTGEKKSKPEKTNWILHQYHLGLTEEEKEGELVVCKVFYQKQPRQCTGGRQAEGAADMENVDLNLGSRDVSTTCFSEVSRGTSVSPKVDTPQRPRSVRSDVTGKTRGAPTQSSKGSELTVIGMNTHALVASELTSTTPVPDKNEALIPGARTGSMSNGGHATNSTLLNTPHEAIPAYPTGWDEEVSTCGKSCQNENDNHVGGTTGLIASEEHKTYQHLPVFESESQQPFPEDGMNFYLLCDEVLGAESVMTDFHDQFGCPEEPYVCNPNADYPDVEGILLDTPPALDMDFILSSQEALDVLGSVKPLPTFLDNDDSLSST